VEFILETPGQGRSRVTLEEAAWLVWTSESRAGIRAAMSSAQFVHLNAPVLAIQQNGQIEYFDAEGSRRWSSNIVWLGGNLEMAACPDLFSKRGFLHRED
jgi:hypothetical protein